MLQTLHEMSLQPPYQGRAQAVSPVLALHLHWGFHAHCLLASYPDVPALTNRFKLMTYFKGLPEFAVQLHVDPLSPIYLMVLLYTFSHIGHQEVTWPSLLSKGCWQWGGGTLLQSLLSPLILTPPLSSCWFWLQAHLEADDLAY